MIKTSNHHTSDANNLYGQAMSQKYSANSFKWVEYLSQFKQDFIKNYDENCDKGCFSEVDVEYQKRKKIFIEIYHFYQK